MKYLGAITNDYDLVTKKYVDDAAKVVQTLTSGTEIGSVGGTKLYAPQGGGGGGDMYKSTYDTNNSGVVDNAEALGGIASSGYSKATNIANHLDGVVTDHYYSDKKDAVAFEQLNDGSEGQHDTGMLVERADTEVSALFGIGASGTNHGIYSNTHGRWMIYDDASGNVKIPAPLYTGGLIYADGNSSAIGAQTNPVSESGLTISLSAGTWKTLTHDGSTTAISIPKGVFTGFVDVQFSAATGSYRSIYFGTSSTGTTIGTQVGGSSTSAIINFRHPFTITASSATNYYVRARSGVACNVTAWSVRLLRIR